MFETQTEHKLPERFDERMYRVKKECLQYILQRGAQYLNPDIATAGKNLEGAATVFLEDIEKRYRESTNRKEKTIILHLMSNALFKRKIRGDLQPVLVEFADKLLYTQTLRHDTRMGMAGVISDMVTKFIDSMLAP